LSRSIEMANNHKFEASDTVVMKGEVSGLTRISKKMRLAMFFGALILLGFLLFSIFSLDASNAASSEDAAAKDAEKENTKRGFEPAKANSITQGIGDGSAVISAGNAPTLVLRDMPSDGGAFAFEATVKVPPLNNASSGKPATPLDVTVPSAGETQASAPLTAEQLEAKRVADAKAQLKSQAMAGDIEIGGGFNQAGATNGNVPLNSPFAAAGLANPNGTPAGVPQGFAAPRAQDQDDQNKQGRKESFLREAEAKGTQFYLRETRQAPVSKYEIKMGWKIPAFLIDGLNSDLPGQVCAQVRENVYDTATGKYLLIPQGAKVCGTYDSQVAMGQERALMVWNRIMFDDGSSLSLNGMPGADQAGYAGFEAEVDNHYVRVFTSAALLSVITAGVTFSQPQQSGGNNSALNASQTLSSALGQQLGQTSTSIIQRDLKIQPRLTQQPGYRFNIQVTRDIAFPAPYRKS
jgi:type IV secretory pathway VirB10-like protein